jgi:MFS family permease
LICARDLLAFYVIATPYGLTYGGGLPVVIMINTEFFGLSSSGTIFGILICGATTGGAIEAPLARYIYDVTGGYSIAFLIGGMSLHY